MIVLFLDIDGVLNTHKAFENNYYGIDYKLAKRLNKIIDSVSDLKIVITSSWRYPVINSHMTLTGLCILLGTHGIKAFGSVYDIARADAGQVEHRINIIRDYIKENKVDRWLILDDMPIAPEGEIITEFIQTDSSKGLTIKQTNFIIRYFNDKSCKLQRKLI